TGIGFDGLDFGVEAFGDSIGNGMPQVGDDVFKVAFDHASGGDGDALQGQRGKNGGQDFKDPRAQFAGEAQYDEKKGNERSGEKQKVNSSTPPAPKTIAGGSHDGIHHQIHQTGNGGDDKGDQNIRRAFRLENQRQDLRPNGLHQG